MGAHEKDVSVHALDDQAAAKDVELAEGSVTPTTMAKPFGTLSLIGMGYSISNTGITCIGSLAVSLAGGGRVVFVWGLLLVFLMACCVACSLGELFSAMPHAGGQYYWTSKMAPLRIRRELSYLVGFLSWSGAVVTAASATLAIPQFVLGMVKLARDDFEIETWMVFVGYQITNIVIFCFNLVERFLPAINVFNLGFSIVTAVAIFIALLATTQQKASALDVFGLLENHTGWPDGVAFIAALAGPNYGFACLDAVTHMADEVPNAAVNIPRVLMATVVLGISIGLPFMIGVLFCITDFDTVVGTATGVPSLQLFFESTGSYAASCFLQSMVLVVFAGATYGIHTWQSRMAWAFARDNGWPGSKYLRRLAPSPLGTPLIAHIWSCAWVALLGTVYLGSSLTFNSFVSGGILLQYLSYHVPISLLLLNGRNSIEHGPFWHPKLGLLANIGSLVWIAVTLVFYSLPASFPTTPTTMNYVSAVIVFMLLYAGAFWLFSGRKRRFEGIVLEPEVSSDMERASRAGMKLEVFNSLVLECDKAMLHSHVIETLGELAGAMRVAASLASSKYMESAHASSRRHEEPDVTATQKRARNRLAQQAFRRRQNTYLKELERKLADGDKPDDERIHKLEEENRKLREQLNATVNKLESLQTTLKALTESLLQATQGVGLAEASESPSLPDESTPSTRQTTTDTTFEITDSAPAGQHELLDLNITAPTATIDLAPAPGPDILRPQELVAYGPSTWSSLDLESLPGIWSYSYQMGPSAYTSRSSQSNAMNSIVPTSNSSWSDHMHLLRRAISRKWRQPSFIQMSSSNTSVLRLCVSFALSLFNSLYRPEALVWYTATNYSQNIADVTIWQMSRSKDAYLRLPVQYRPTGLQLTESYPSVIDWCPFPTIRDRLILLHAANPLIDDIICEIATAYVVEVEAAELVQQAVGRGYVRVWDLIHASSKPSTSTRQRDAARPSGFPDTTTTSSSHLPAATIEQLFTRQPASAAFKLLGLGDGIPRFKLDPSFFAKYPELYDPEVDIVASGTPIAPAWQTSIPTPTPPAMETRHIYWHSVDWSMSALSRGMGTLPII